MKIKFSILLVSMVLAISSCGQITELTKPEPDPLLLQACSKLSLFIDLAGADSRESSTWAQEYLDLINDTYSILQKSKVPSTSYFAYDFYRDVYNSDHYQVGSAKALLSEAQNLEYQYCREYSK
jgi:hypothetical protein